MPNIIEKYYNELKNLESYFKCAVKANYIRNLYRTDIDLLLKFYVMVWFLEQHILQ